MKVSDLSDLMHDGIPDVGHEKALSINMLPDLSDLSDLSARIRARAGAQYSELGAFVFPIDFQKRLDRSDRSGRILISKHSLLSDLKNCVRVRSDRSDRANVQPENARA